MLDEADDLFWKRVLVEYDNCDDGDNDVHDVSDHQYVTDYDEDGSEDGAYHDENNNNSSDEDYREELKDGVIGEKNLISEAKAIFQDTCKTKSKYNFICEGTVCRFAIFDSGTEIRLNYTDILAEKLMSLSQYKCPIRFLKKTKMNTMHISSFECYAACLYPNCIKYKFCITEECVDDNMRLHIYAKGEYTDHPSNILKGRLLKGKRRQETANVLEICGSAKRMYEHSLQKLSSEEYQARNKSKCPTPNVLRQALYEKHLGESKGSHELNHIYNTCHNNNDISSTFLRELSMKPYRIRLALDAQIKAYNTAASDNNCVIQIDATGCILRKPSFLKKRILYYPLLLKGQFSETTTTVCALFTSSHDTQEIFTFISNFLMDCEKFSHKRLLPQIINTDFSWPLLCGSIKACNGLSLSKYIKTCFSIDTHTFILDNTCFTILHLCTAHFSAQVERNLKKITKNENIHNFSHKTIMLLCKCTSLEQLLHVTKHYVYIFGSEILSHTVNLAYNEIVDLIRKNIDICTEEQEDGGYLQEQHMNMMKNIHTTIRDTSPYYSYFKEKIQQFKEELNIKDNKFNYPLNKFYCPAVINYLQEKLLPISCLWSATILSQTSAVCLTTDERKQLTNNAIESSFNTIKNVIFKKIRNNKGAKVVTTLHNHFVAITRRYFWYKDMTQRKRLDKKRKRRNKQKGTEFLFHLTDVTFDEESLLEENWRRGIELEMPFDNEDSDVIPDDVNIKRMKLDATLSTHNDSVRYIEESWGKKENISQLQKVMRNFKSKVSYKSSTSFLPPLTSTPKKKRPMSTYYSCLEKVDAWLDDETIDHALLCLMKNDSLSDAVSIPCFVFALLLRNSYQDAVHIIFNHNILNRTTIICPMNTDLRYSGQHWILVVIRRVESKIYILDSMGHQFNKDNEIALSNFLKLLNICLDHPKSTDEYEIVHVTNVPQQLGAWECGVAVVANALSILSREEFISANNLDDFRAFLRTELKNYIHVDQGNTITKKDAKVLADITINTKREIYFKTTRISIVPSECFKTFSEDETLCQYKNCIGYPCEDPSQKYYKEQIFCNYCCLWYHVICESLLSDMGGNTDVEGNVKTDNNRCYMCISCKSAYTH